MACQVIKKVPNLCISDDIMNNILTLTCLRMTIILLLNGFWGMLVFQPAGETL